MDTEGIGKLQYGIICGAHVEYELHRIVNNTDELNHEIEFWKQFKCGPHSVWEMIKIKDEL